MHGNRTAAAFWFVPPILVAVMLSATPSFSAKPADPAAAVMLDTEITKKDAGTVVVRSAFEIRKAPHRWFTQYIQVQFPDKSFLKGANGKDFLRAWGDIFTPKADSAHYEQCRLGLDLSDLEKCTNLPPGKRSILLISSNIWDQERRKYIGYGWPVRCPLAVTTDAKGKIIRAEPFHTPPAAPAKNASGQKIDAVVCTLRLKHLKPTAGLQAARTQTMRKMDVFHLALGGRQSRIQTTDRGFFFGPIDTPDKARELVELGLPKSMIVNDAAQFNAIVAAMKKIPQWKPQRWMPKPKPDWFGLTVTPMAGLGYEVKALVFWHFGYGVMEYRHLYQKQFRIATDGRMWRKDELIISGPAPPYGIPPGWRPEFGHKPKPKPPAPKSRPAGSTQPVRGRAPTPADSPFVAYWAQTAAIEKALMDGHYEVIAPRLVATDKKVKFPRAEGENRGD